METIRKYYRVHRKEICYLKFILEAYDGIAMLRTIDAAKGLVAFQVAPDCEADLDELILHIGNDLMMEPGKKQ